MRRGWRVPALDGVGDKICRGRLHARVLVVATLVVVATVVVVATRIAS